MNKRIHLSSPTMYGEEQEYVKEAFETNWIAPLGPNVDEFEKEISRYIGGNVGAAALSSGTAAIHLALKAAGVEKGDIVFCSDLTFSATCNPILYQSAVPVFIDCEYESWNMSPEALKKAFDKYNNVKAVIVVNLYGAPARLDVIKDICSRRGVTMVEDAAESLGATYQGKQTGTFGEFGIFSFNGNKIITTSGGGMLVSEDEEAVKKVRFWSTQSRENERHYEHKEIGYNYRMSNVVAGIGRGQLLHLDENIRLKKRIYEKYKKDFEDIDAIKMNPIIPESEPNYWLSCLTLESKSKVKPVDIIKALESENIEARPVWKPMHLQPVFEKYDYIGLDDGESVGKDVFDRGVCLPSDVKCCDEDLDKVVRIVRELFDG